MELLSDLQNHIITTESGRDVIPCLNLGFSAPCLSRSIRGFFVLTTLQRSGKICWLAFHITNLPRSYQLSQQIWSLQQGSMDLATYYTTLKNLWDELDGANCVNTCRHCECCRATETNADHAKVIKFLSGLNESYSFIRSQIIMTKHIPELSEIYNLLDQDHNQRNIIPVQNAIAF